MLKHYDLFDPIQTDSTMKDEEFTKYINICVNQVGPTPLDMIQEIQDTLYATARVYADDDASMAHLDKIWEFIKSKLVDNQGLAQFTLDYGGAKSLYFFPWLVSVFKSPSEALEMAYGSGYDLFGNWVDDIDKGDDPIVYFVRNDPTFVYNRERQLKVADLVTTVRDNSWEADHHGKVVDFGAGRLAWARWHGYTFTDTEFLSIYAFDKDPSIKPDELFEDPLSELNLHFKHGDLLAQVRNPDCSDADLIILGGVASYIPMDVFIKHVLTPIHDLLTPNGTFFFDLQLDCPYLQRSMKLWDWPELQLYQDAAAAISSVEAIRKDMWQDGLKFGAEYAVDTYNASPSAVMITLTKVV